MSRVSAVSSVCRVSGSRALAELSLVSASDEILGWLWGCDQSPFLSLGTYVERDGPHPKTSGRLESYHRGAI
ncbi:hypothetical protein NDU88_004725 [Pleurodeles waltl]|uniref:Uncharacterized protein n=1 Tax=Pleurodeles waltl TaxID=8319 RepID=A0AAV7TSQ4_PLEWA|nr:hypothetical protein NDU88_004725 [Pleurodeles waltl]